MARASGNVVLEIFVKALLSIADGGALGVSYPRATRLRVHQAHDRIVQALGTGDPVATETAMFEHLRESRDYWVRRHPEVLERPVGQAQLAWGDHPLSARSAVEHVAVGDAQQLVAA